MFKVICINGVKSGTPAYDTDNAASVFDEVHEGEIYTVVKQREYAGYLCYFLAEKRPNAVYYSGLFAPISKIDETTFERNYNKEPV